MDAELVDDARLNGVLAAPVAEDVPGDLRRTPDEELEAPDVRVVVAPRRRREEDGPPSKREAPEPKDLRARFPVVVERQGFAAAALTRLEKPDFSTHQKNAARRETLSGPSSHVRRRRGS